MAKVRAFSDSFFVFTVIILLIFPCFNAEDVYFYTSDRSISNQGLETSFKLLDSRHRRDILPVASLTEAKPTKPTYLPTDKNSTTTAQTATEKKPPKKAVVVPTATLPKNSSTTGQSPATVDPNQELPMKNLGVNGTGIRWANATALSPSINVAKEHSNDTPTDQDLSYGLDDDESFEKYEGRSEKFNTEVKKNEYFVNKTDTHIYYNSTFTTVPDIRKKYWVNFTNSKDAITHDLLSVSHRRAATVKLNFDFPFYGHLIRNVTVATGGFIYTGDYVHSWLAATQYIAPLMANFDTSISNDSYIKFLDNGTAFTVQWENVSLQDKPDKGKFTFQATLHKNGDIVFVYLNVPDIIKTIEDVFHPVTIGLSDAYIIDNAEYYVHRKTIFEYHKVTFGKDDIKNSTVIYLTALPTCLQKKDCGSCLNNTDIAYKCTWCPVISRCSSGIDRFRHEWIQKNCDKKQMTTGNDCQALYSATQDDVYNSMERSRKTHLENVLSLQSKSNDVGGPSAVIAGMFLSCIALLLVLWVVYAYRNPHTSSGQLLIRSFDVVSLPWGRLRNRIVTDSPHVPLSNDNE